MYSGTRFREHPLVIDQRTGRFFELSDSHICQIQEVYDCGEGSSMSTMAKVKLFRKVDNGMHVGGLAEGWDRYTVYVFICQLLVNTYLSPY